MDNSQFDHLLPKGDSFPKADSRAWNEDDVPERKPLTVGELKEYIKDIPEGTLISLEGCDCVGTCYGVTYDQSDNVLEMERQ